MLGIGMGRGLLLFSLLLEACIMIMYDITSPLNNADEEQFKVIKIQNTGI